MIGLIVWIVMIAIMVTLIIPGFWWHLLLCMLIVAGASLAIVVLWKLFLFLLIGFIYLVNPKWRREFKENAKKQEK